MLLSLLLPATALLLLLAHSCHGSDDDHFYLDLPSREGFACPEVNSFVNEFDPLYRWSLRSSLASVLSTTTGVDVELANSAYQQASAWRVISNSTSDGGANKLYASAEPHIAGGHMKQHRRNWQWRMQVDWGISIRMCLSIGGSQSNRSCLWTTAILSMENEVDLSLLLVGVPYRAATAPSIEPDLKNMQHSTAGFYLSNYASNARTDFTKYQKLNSSSHYYVTNTNDVPKCGFAPSYYSNDAAVYLGFPTLQCGCSNSSTKVCVVVTKNMDTSRWGPFDYRSPCNLLKSYWAWNAGGTNWLVLNTHNTSSDKPAPFIATFKGNVSFGYALTTVTADNLQAMVNTTSCVEALMQQSPVPSSVEVQNRCSTNQLVLSIEDGEYYLNKMRQFLWAPTPRENKISTPCSEDLPMGQLEFKDKLCVSKLDTAISTEIKLMIESMLQLRDVKFKQNKLWKDGSNNRNQVYTGILSAIVSFLGTCFLATSHKLQDIEESFQNFWNRGGAVGDSNTDDQAAQSSSKSVFSSQDPIFWVKFLYRTLLVLSFAVLLAYTAYSSVESVEKDRDMLQAQTVPQVLSDGSVVLLTTTATYECDIAYSTSSAKLDMQVINKSFSPQSLLPCSNKFKETISKQMPGFLLLFFSQRFFAYALVWLSRQLGFALLTNFSGTERNPEFAEKALDAVNSDKNTKGLKQRSSRIPSASLDVSRGIRARANIILKTMQPLHVTYRDLPLHHAGDHLCRSMVVTAHPQVIHERDLTALLTQCVRDCKLLTVNTASTLAPSQVLVFIPMISLHQLRQPGNFLANFLDARMRSVPTRNLCVMPSIWIRLSASSLWRPLSLTIFFNPAMSFSLPVWL
ncbi:hypothetical protein SELMODRAFT_419126 [Selaginella moellendorffii]|uniref:Uncharacterized protein n=1 Tax=Selaginella moellendorffii TaxID=88036 RepID=D8S7X7_SELML|nr:hypothetical protein SELMODRAFT_419126 [Selaginella moellendorffii]